LLLRSSAQRNFHYASALVLVAPSSCHLLMNLVVDAIFLKHGTEGTHFKSFTSP